jgi:hypothetical protein
MLANAGAHFRSRAPVGCVPGGDGRLGPQTLPVFQARGSAGAPKAVHAWPVSLDSSGHYGSRQAMPRGSAGGTNAIAIAACPPRAARVIRGVAWGAERGVGAAAANPGSASGSARRSAAKPTSANRNTANRNTANHSAANHSAANPRAASHSAANQNAANQNAANNHRRHCPWPPTH